MWAAQFFKFEETDHWMTSGGLGTMGYGLPAAIGVQRAHPNVLVIDIAGEASILMNMQECRLPCSIGCRSRSSLSTIDTWAWCGMAGIAARRALSESYTEALPNFVKLAEA